MDPRKPLASQSIWRRKDSSEKTPSTVASDDEQCPFPAAIVSSASLAASPALGTENAAVETSPGGAGPSSVGHSAVAPLQPMYPPPLRVATPEGLPSYEVSQRVVEARLARRALDPAHPRLDEPDRVRSSRRRRCSGQSTAAGHAPPLWRAPASQHSMAHHPHGPREIHNRPVVEPESLAGGDSRPIRLEDFYFLRLRGTGGDGHSHSRAASDREPGRRRRRRQASGSGVALWRCCVGGRHSRSAEITS